VRFEWDAKKAASNELKHGVTFDEAASAFADDYSLIMSDPDHSDEEDRFILLAGSSARLLVVCHCYREDDAVIRIISARPATKREHDTYRQRRRT
jgi:uncharacterized protein